MKFNLSFIAFYMFLINLSFSQIEIKPFEKKIEVEKNSNSILKLPENNLPEYLKKDFFSNNPNVNEPKGFENNIRMENEEAFINPGDAYLKKLNSNKSEGSGLGLSIAQQILSSHRGKIVLLESSSNGSTFQFSIPLSKSKCDLL